MKNYHIPEVLGLIPVFQKKEPQLAFDSLKDITLDTVLETFSGTVPESWDWIDASKSSVIYYAKHSLLSLCSDHECIKTTQGILDAFLKNRGLTEFFMRSNFDQDRDNSYRGLEALSAFVASVHSELVKVRNTEALKSFLRHVEDLDTSQRMQDLRHFLKLFNGTLVFDCYLAKHIDEDDHRVLLKRWRDYPIYSEERNYPLCCSFRFHNVKCTAIGENGEGINIEDAEYLTEWRSSLRWLMHIPNDFICQMLGIDFEQLFTDFLPDWHEPIKAKLTIEPRGDHYKISLRLEETDASKVLRLRGGVKVPKTLILEDRTDDDPEKGKRTQLQNSLLGKEKVISVKKDDYPNIYGAKVTYFSKFLETYAEDSEKFGQFLVELRYLASVVNFFSMLGIRTPLTFPKAMSMEENLTAITDLKNPTLMTSSAGIGVVPNDVFIDREKRAQIITGPNQNGKSRYMDSIGLAQIMFQAGWPILAREASMSPKTDLCVHYVRSRVGIDGESRFSHECSRMRSIFEICAGPYPLFLVDEPYTGTNSKDAETLLKEMLKACSEFDMSILMTTHYHGLIQYMNELKNGFNLHCVVGEDESFTFKINPGSSTKSNALKVAEVNQVRFVQLRELMEFIKSGKVREISELPF